MPRVTRRLALAALALCGSMALGIATEAQADDKVSFVTNWTAEAEHGGFYEALAAGIYKKHGLDVTLRQGGPQVNTSQMIAAGAVDFRMGDNSFDALNYAQQGIPVLAVAAMFQKDPAVLISHPGVGMDTLESIKGKPVALSQDAIITWWAFLKAKFGYTDAQIRPYNFDVAPFLVNKGLVQEGYATSEPYAIEQAGKFKPNVFLVADLSDYNSYSTTIETTQKMVTGHPDIVQRFVDASIEGWYLYLYGDPMAANALIMKDNPEMTADQIAFSIAAMKSYGIVDSGDAASSGIGAMSAERWKSFFEKSVALGLYPAGLDYTKAFSSQFVNKKVGVELRK